MGRRIVRHINYFLEWVLRQIGRKGWVSACRSWLGNLTLTEICELKFSVIQAWLSEGWAHYAMDLLLYQWQECAANFQRHGIYCT